MKQKYEKADAEVVLFGTSDVVTTSGGGYCAPWESAGEWVKVNCTGLDGSEEWVNGSNVNC